MRFSDLAPVVMIALALAACQTTRAVETSGEHSSTFEARFAALFDDPEAARRAWRDFGGRMARKVQTSVFPAVSDSQFGARAIARVREVRAAYPETSPTVLSFVALDGFLEPAWLTRPDRNAVVQVVDFMSQDGARATRLASIVSTADPRSTVSERDGVSFALPKESGFGVAVLKVPVLDSSLGPDALSNELTAELVLHRGPMILDLRGNTGGLLDMVPRLAGFFLPPESPVLELETRSGRVVYRSEEPLGEAPIGPVLVLADEQTNAGALAVAAGLQDHGVGQIAGAIPAQVRGAIETWQRLDICPPGVASCAIKYPSGKIIRPSGADLGEAWTVDYPVAPHDLGALAHAVTAWREEIVH